MAATRLFALEWIVAAACAVAVSVGATSAARATDSASTPISARDKAIPLSSAAGTETGQITAAQPIVAPQDAVADVAIAAPVPNREKATGAQAERVLKEMTGVASWYGPGFHGRRTANGERFDQNSLTAAHKTLPFNTRVRVTSLLNGRSVIVTINDRGPYVRGRTIDLSAAAAREIGMVGRGVGKVKLEILDTPLDVAHEGGSRAADTRETAAVPRRTPTVVATE